MKMLVMLLVLQQDEPLRITRERLAEIGGAVGLHYDAKGKWPASLDEAARFAGIDVPKDGWGRAFVYAASPELSDATKERFARAVAKLASDEFETRHEGQAEIELLGPVVLDLLRIEQERTADAEVKGRLEAIRKKLRRPDVSGPILSLGADGKEGGAGADADIGISVARFGLPLDGPPDKETLRVAAAAVAVELGSRGDEFHEKPTLDRKPLGDGIRFDRFDAYWRVGLKRKEGAAVCIYRYDGKVAPERCERAGSTILKTFTTAEADFRCNDRDENRLNEFWVADVSSLYRCKAHDGTMIRLIDPAAAKADVAPLPESDFIGKALCDMPEPYYGYLVRVMKGDSQGGYAEDNDKSGRKWTCRTRFGFCAYPAVYGVTGRLTFMVNEDNTIWKKDTGGRPVEEFPQAPGRDRWSRLD